ncbi:MAG: hypothetical protein ACYDGN_08260 [Acidimicrobiales bacterium]
MSTTTVGAKGTSHHGWKTLTLAGARIQVPADWLVIYPTTHNGCCVTPRSPGTVWLGRISGFDCPAGEPGAAPAGATLVVFSRGLTATPQDTVGSQVVNRLRVSRVDWHLVALYSHEWPKTTGGYYSSALRVGLAAVGPKASQVLSTLSAGR